MYYVYAHTKPSGEIFYIGKGKNKRAFDSAYRNRHWNFIVKKHGVRPVILAEFENEIDALNEEKELVSYFRKFGVLTNITDGGDSNPMSIPKIAQKVADTKRAKGQYNNAWASWNNSFKENMKNPEFAKEIKEKRIKAHKASVESRRKKMIEKAKQVIQLRKQGLKYAQIQQEIGVSIGIISRILNNRGNYANLA